MQPTAGCVDLIIKPGRDINMILGPLGCRSLHMTQALYLLVDAWHVKTHQSELTKCISQLVSCITGM